MVHALHTLDDSPWFEWIELSETGSTNDFLKNYRPAVSKDMTLVTADYQQAGKGQVGNTWESEAGANLLFSLRVHPSGVDVRRQFVLSQAMSLAVSESLGQYTEGIRIKWPNDIYWHDRKICGMLIENFLSGKCIETSIIGVGVNVNQKEFRSDAPNPVSLYQILEAETERVFLLADIVERFKTYYRKVERAETEDMADRYRQALYRGEGFHRYEDRDGLFEACIREVEPTGHLVLCDRQGRFRRYAFKEVRFVLPENESSIK
jgi:biotin--[acetyl-coA-carboxylase] ligase